MGKNVGTLCGRALEYLGEESHRVGRVREGRQAHRVKRRDEEAARNADGLVHVVVLAERSIPQRRGLLREDDDDPRHDVEEGLVRCRAERSDRLAPCLRQAATLVVGALLFLRCQPDAVLGLRIADRDEGPRLLVRATRSGVGRGHRDLDELARDRLRTEVAHAAARVHALEEGAPGLLGIGDARGGVRDESSGHATSLPPASTSAMPFFTSTRVRRIPPMMKKTTRARIATR